MLFLLLTCCFSTVASQSTLSISVSSTAPSTAVSASPALLSFSIEGDRWPEWVATAPSFTSQNSFTLNALNNLKTITGTPPNIRVGANSEDRTDFNPGLAVSQTSFPPPTASNPYPEASTINVGPGYYALSRFLPSGTHMTWGINFGTNNITAATLEAQSILNAFRSSAVTSAGISLDLLELGNEPDLYGNNGHRASGYSIGTYVTEWSNFMGRVVSATGLSAGVRPFILGCSFGNSDNGKGGFSPQQAINDGLLNSNAGKLITVISQHKYSGGCCTAQISDLMSKSLIRSNLTAFIPDIQAVKAAGLKYIFGESNSYFNHGVPNVSDAGGAAVWLTDFILFGASLGISNFFMHEGVGFKYNLIQPVSLNRSTEDATPLNPPVAAHIQAPYYSAIVLAEFLGSSGTRSLVELPTSSSSIISAYALYTSPSTLSKIVIINHQSFTGTGTRPSVAVTLNLSGGARTGTVKRLNIPNSSAKTGLRWAGQTYETADAKVSGSLSTTSLNTSGPVTVSATEVVLITF